MCKANFTVDPNWKLITTEEMLEQQKYLKNAKSSPNKELSLSITEKNKLSTILTPAQIYKIIVCKREKGKIKQYISLF